MNTFTFKKYKVKYITAGKGDPIIFLHNGGSDHILWEHQINHFSKSHAVFALDMPGYGESDKPDIDYTLRFYADMLASFIEKNNLIRPVLVGNCLGSATSLLCAMDNPGRVRSLVLFNILTEKTLSYGTFGFLLKVSKKSACAKKMISKLAGSLVLPRMMRKPMIRKQFGSVVDPDPEYLSHVSSLYGSKDQLRVLYSIILNIDSFKILDSFVKPADFPPIYLIWGNLNKTLPAKGGRELMMRIKPDRNYFADGCGHLMMREIIEEVNNNIDVFLRQHAGQG